MPFPEEIVTFPTLEDASTSDGDLIKQYQVAMENQDSATALAILQQIPNYDKKMITSYYLNSIAQTVLELEYYYLTRYSPSVIVSASQPPQQQATDFWFEVTG